VAVAYPTSEGASTGAEALLVRADRALYAAKGAGRDCTEVAEPDSVES
jgi:GGDEF domain-containing protein